MKLSAPAVHGGVVSRMPELAPPNSLAEIGDLGSKPLTPEERERTVRFALLWQPTVATLRRRGWQYFNAASVVELYVSRDEPKNLKRLWLSPTKGLFRVRMDFATPKLHDAALAEFHEFVFPGVRRLNVTEEKLSRKKGRVRVMEARTALADLLNGATGAEELASRIRAIVVAVLDRADAMQVTGT